MLQLANPNIKFQFTNSSISSHGGIFLYHDFINRLDLKERLRSHVFFTNHSWRTHEPSDVIIQKCMALLAGLEDNNDVNDLKYDPVYQHILKSSLASQPTLSRLERSSDQSTIDGFYNLNLELLHQQWQREGRTELILDVDSTDCVVHGQQRGSAYHGYYKNKIYHPLCIFEGNTGDFIKAVLRHGNTSSTHKIVKLLMPLIEQLLTYQYSITLRADAGMNDPIFYAFCELWNIEYVIRLKKNSVLVKKAEELLPIKPSYQRTDEVNYAECEYKAKSWNKARRVHIKQVYRADQLFPEYYFFLNNSQKTSEEVCAFYNKRGTSENYIKESKMDCGFERLSCKTFWANAFRFQCAVLTYNINNLFRRTILPEELNRHSLNTLRVKLINTGCRIIRHARQVICQFGKSFRIKKLFEKIITRLRMFSLSLPPP